MKQEYDFSKGERREVPSRRLPSGLLPLILTAYLEENVPRYLDERAESKGMAAGEAAKMVSRSSSPNRS